MSYEQVRDWFAEVQRRLDMGLDPFQDPAVRRPHGEGEDTHGPGGDQSGLGMGEEEDDEDEDGEDSDDSEVWEPSRSVRKSLSVSED